MDTHAKRPQGLLPLGLSVLLWATSALLTLALFWNLAGLEWWMKTIAVAWGFGLEGTKIVSWRLGGRYRWLAAALVALTLFSVWGLAVGSVEGQIEKTETARTESTHVYQDTRQSIVVLQAQIEALVARLRTMPVDFVTATDHLNLEIQHLRDRLDTKLRELSQASANDAETRTLTNPFSVLAAILQWPRRSVVILILLIVAVLTEVSAFAMVGHRVPAPLSVSHKEVPDPTEEDYLRVALDHSGAPRLLGRLEMARRLGISENQARVLLQRLVNGGRVRKGAKSFEFPKAPPPKRPPKPPATS